MKEMPATSKESELASKDLKQRGFKFVGSTIIYAHMQAAGNGQRPPRGVLPARGINPLRDRYSLRKTRADTRTCRSADRTWYVTETFADEANSGTSIE